MSFAHFQKELETNAGVKLQLKINDNRSTMLSVKWEPDQTKVSLHRMFLDAPRNIMESLACYLRQERQEIDPIIKAFIEKNLQNLDYSHRLNRKNLYSQGNVFDLKKIYNGINGDYFDSRLKLDITWFGKPSHRNRSRFTFGLYCDALKLIKINRFLDSPAFPDYVVAFVVYHEMLHHVCPAYMDEKGMNHIHSQEFKKLETQYQYYQLAQDWIKQRQNDLFASI